MTIACKQSVICAAGMENLKNSGADRSHGLRISMGLIEGVAGGSSAIHPPPCHSSYRYVVPSDVLTKSGGATAGISSVILVGGGGSVSHGPDWVSSAT